MLDLKLTADSYWKFQPKMTTTPFWNSFYSNRPLPSSKNSRFRNETKGKTFVVKMSFIYMRIKKNHFHINNNNININNNNNNNNNDDDDDDDDD